ncbi:MAG: DUF4347 domain-containing protein, partial [Thiotrichales bacterium]|nr:DUF4347 domain-containing protein [Thiotrichales bacterium]
MFSHGATGRLLLGNAVLDQDSMSGVYADELSGISTALTDSADILIYGCNFAEGSPGLTAARMLSNLTGADVAGSEDLTGHDTLGGDWDLELETGVIESDLLVSVETRENWQSMLAVPALNLDTDNSQSNNNVFINVTPDGNEVNVTDDDVTIVDADDTAMASVQIQAVAVRDGNSEVISFAGTEFQLATTANADVTAGGTTFDISYDATTETFTIINDAGGDAPIADVITLIESTTYKNNAASPSAGYRAFNFTVNDGDTDSALVTSSILVGAATDLKFDTINGGFEEPDIPDNTFQFINQALVPGWDTTDSSGNIEIWGTGFLGVAAAEGAQFAELNATESASLSQTLIDIQPGGDITFEFYHRGRAGVDTARLTVTDADTGTVLFQQDYSTGTAAWVQYTGTFTVPVTSSEVDVTFTAVSTGSGSLSVGNFLDGVVFTFSGPTPDTFVINEDAALSGVAPGLIGNDLDANTATAASISAVNGSAANVGTQITLASGALLTVNADGSYDYDQNGQFSTLTAGETVNDSFFYTFDDGDGNINSSVVNITINGVNDPPVLDLDVSGAGDGFTNTYTENSAAVNITDSDVSITDSENQEVTLQIVAANIADGADEVLNFGGSQIPMNADTALNDVVVGGVTVDVNYVTATQTFTITNGSGGTLTAANAASVLAAITYQNNSEGPGTAVARTFTITANDGTNDSNAAVSTINVTSVNDAPVVTAPVSQLLYHNTALNIHGTGFTLTDVDANSGILNVTLNVPATEGTINVAAGDSGVINITNDGTNNVTLQGTATQINNLLSGASTGTITYTDPGGTVLNTTFTVTVNDAGNTGTDPGLTGDGSSEEGTNSVVINLDADND